MEQDDQNYGAMTKRPIAPKPKKVRPPAPPLYVGGWIRAMGSTPAKVARGAPVNEGYLSELINGQKKNPSIEVLQAIALFIGIPRDKFHEPPPPKAVIDAARKLGPDMLSRLHRPDDTQKH